MSDAPSPKRKRVVVCRGQYCNMGRRADKVLKRLEVLVDDINGDQYPKPVKLEIANCLSMCGAGPNLVIYPEGAVFNGVDETQLDAIVRDHLLLTDND
ncbi:MAG: (2Fe-2S) ferredoxin domain-containing protein [Chloroflexi bacterium]|nr:(2Fe-2S) ferredoxin domain-containing protein [Chloroflexota bacterium]MCC6892168.1 (2Fe-2S) ferredoxin domain-containing protein [Anaerolineae bacterium]